MKSKGNDAIHLIVGIVIGVSISAATASVASLVVAEKIISDLEKDRASSRQDPTDPGNIEKAAQDYCNLRESGTGFDSALNQGLSRFAIPQDERGRSALALQFMDQVKNTCPQHMKAD